MQLEAVKPMKSVFMAGVAAILLVAGSTGAGAQQRSDKRVASKGDWAVFADENPRSCWVVAAPSETVNTKGGRVVSVRRGDILLMVSYIPGRGIRGQVSFTGGYRFAKGSQVRLEIGQQTFHLLTVPEDDPATAMPEYEFAWTYSEADDARIITAMKRGARAIVTGLSSRGTTTRDTFSLLGFTAAVEDAAKRCSG